MPSTPRMGWSYPNFRKDPWYDHIASLFGEQDVSAYAAREDRGLLPMAGGTFTWVASTGLLTWTDTIEVFSPIAGFKLNVAAGSVTLPTGGVFYAELVRNPTQSTSISALAAAKVPSSDTAYVLAVRNGDSLYFRNGLVLESGDSKDVFAGGGSSITPAGYAAFNRTTGVGYATIQAAINAVANYNEIFIAPGNHTEDLVLAPASAKNNVKVWGFNAERAYGTNVQSMTMAGAFRNWQFIGIRFQTNDASKSALHDTGSQNVIFDHCSFRGDPGAPGVVPVMSLGGYTGSGDPPILHNCYVADDSSGTSLEIRADALDPAVLVQFDDCFGLPKMTLNGLTGASVFRCDLIDLITHNAGVCVVALSSVREIVSSANDMGGGFPFLWVANCEVRDDTTFVHGIINKTGTCGYFVEGTRFAVDASTLAPGALGDLAAVLGSVVRFFDIRVRGYKAQVMEGGITAARPLAPTAYEMYFDTTLGKPIWWSGTMWVDATGAGPV